MDAITWLNLVLAIVWATLFMYLLNLRKRVWIARIRLHGDYMYIASRIYKLHAIWGRVARIVAMCDKYNLTPEDKKTVSTLFREVAEIMEESDGEESLRESRGDSVPVG